MLVGLELLLFWGYFAGTVSPAPDDFIGSYNNEPWAWWRDLAPGDLPDWVPYAWAGYPAAASIQNGSWYLPLGAMALLTPFSIHAAAVLQAIHIGVGALGAYVLGRGQRLHHLAAIFGLVAYFFASGFYTNGLHPDIVRGFAWAPWVVLCLLPSFPWRRWWAVPFAAIVLWQALAGSYPGIIVVLAYACLAFVVTHQLTTRPRFRDYLLPVSLAGIGALLLSAPKYVPAVLFRATMDATGPDESVFPARMLSTLFYPYDLASLPNDLSMRSFFVVAPAWVLLALAFRRRSRSWPVIAMGVTAAAFGLPFLPTYDAVAHLPGITMSRFRMADSRVPLTLAIVMAAMVVISSEVRRHEHGQMSPLRRRFLVGALLVSVPAAALVIAVNAGYPIERWTVPWALVVGSAVLVACLLGGMGGLWRSGTGASPATAAVALTVLAGVSGVQWAFSVMPPWRAPLEQIEERAWGASSEELISEYTPDPAQTQRPARTPLDDAVAPPPSVHWNTSFYTGEDAVGGYVNLRGTGTFGAMYLATITDATYMQSRTLLAAPGLGIQVDSDSSLPATDAVTPCALEGRCGADLTLHATGYEAGHLQYSVTARADVPVLFNEAFYDGWTITACRPDTTECQRLDGSMGAAGLIFVEVPEGDWDLTLDYRTPGRTRDLVLFGLGVALLGAVAVRTQIRSRSDVVNATRSAADDGSRPPNSEGDANGGNSRNAPR